MEKLKKFWNEWKDELAMLFASFGVLATVSLLIVLVFGADAAPFDLGVIQRILITYAKFACFHVIALSTTWLMMRKWTTGGGVVITSTWELLRVYFLYLAALVLLSFT